MTNQSFTWKGRNDGEGTAHLRIHQIMNQELNHHQKDLYTLIGFCSDEGVKRNQGRIGAAEAPDLIRAQFANLPVHESICIQDIGNVECVNGELEQAHVQLAEQIKKRLEKHEKPIILGGGHEVAFGSFSGLFSYNQAHAQNKKIGIINFDAHFDLREEAFVSSGTPFLNAAKLSEKFDQEFNYLCIGVAKHSNTKILFETADRLNCTYIYDHQLQQQNLHDILEKINHFIEKVDDLYVTIDLDVFSSSIAPGVSAPAVKGIDLTIFESVFQSIKKTGKIKLFDVAEYNPRFDTDHRTAKLAAYLIFKYIFD